jgi:hypothetical protein
VLRRRRKMIRKATKKRIDIEWLSFEGLKEYLKPQMEKDICIDCKEMEFKEYTIMWYKEVMDMQDVFKIETLEGLHYMTKDDVLIIGIKGEIYPCNKDIFKLTYDFEDDTK